MQYELNALNNRLGRVLLEVRNKGMESVTGHVDRSRELVDNVLEGDFRYFSKASARYLLINEQHQISSMGLNLFVESHFPSVCSPTRAFTFLL